MWKKVGIGATGLVLVLALGGFLMLRSVGMFASEPVYTTDNGAIDGYDPVAYFAEARAVPGSAEHTAEWGGSTWRFATAENKAAFEAEPARYAPQYGGYCAFGMAGGYTAYTDPEAWTVAQGKLYLNFDAKVMADWRADQAALIAKADANWPEVAPK